MRVICSICLFFITLYSPLASSTLPEVKVLIGKSLKKVKIRGNNLKRRFKHEKKIKKYKGLKTVVFNCNKKTKSLKKKNLLASLKTDNQIIKWENNLYEGELLIESKARSKSCDLIMKTSMDKYISLLLSKEMNAAWPIEALKAQAVAARTYAYFKMKNNSNESFHLENSEKHQVNGTVKDESRNTKEASRSTSEQILVNSTGELQPIFYHSKCGGKTLLPSDVWGGHIKGYKSVICPFCVHHGEKQWNKSMNTDKFARLLKKIYKKKFGAAIYDMSLKKNTKDIYSFHDHMFNRSTKIFHSGKTQVVSKPKLRNLSGRSLIPSNNYTIKIKGKKVHLSGRGYGHGVGLCQIGALELAKRGYNYREILSYYFPKHKIVNIKKNKYF